MRITLKPYAISHQVPFNFHSTFRKVVKQQVNMSQSAECGWMNWLPFSLQFFLEKIYTLDSKAIIIIHISKVFTVNKERFYSTSLA